MRSRFWSAAVLVLLLAGAGSAQNPDAGAWAAHVGAAYRVASDVVYQKATNYDLKLDVYVPMDATGPLPVAMYFHGGGWTARSKEYMVLNVLPYLEMGWVVVNVGYRLAGVANAPAAVEDGRCALRWVIRNAKQYMIDPSKIVNKSKLRSIKPVVKPKEIAVFNFGWYY